MKRLTDRLTYANVTATLALFVALGGTSYAAIALPRNSVGSRQVRTGAVHSSEIRDRSIRLRDLSLTARSQLRGAIGPTGATGATGAQGPAGAAAVGYFAVVDASGGLVRGNATSGGSGGSTGTYVIGFARSVANCAYSATLGSADGSVTPTGRVTVRPVDGRVGVATTNAAGTPTDLPFHLVVAC